jgi:hypothetical protein
LYKNKVDRVPFIQEGGIILRMKIPCKGVIADG